AAERRDARDFLDLHPDHIDAAFVAAVQLVIVLLPLRAVHVAREGDGTRRLAGARGAGEEEVRQVPLLGIGLKSFDDVVLPDDLAQGLRSILLDPDLLHRSPDAPNPAHA